MAITDRDLKILWGRAAGCCSMCRAQLTENGQSPTDAFVIGEAAHIVAGSSNGPRGDEGLPERLRDSYVNLILLCPSCHTSIDKAPADYPAERLRKIKSDHEAEMACLHPSDKDSVDGLLEFGAITEKNWLSPDRKNYIPFGVTKEQWISPFLSPRLDAGVPLRVIRAFEVARAVMIYSWFSYPLATAGLEQLLLVARFALRERCHLLQQKPENFGHALKILVELNLIHAADASRWDALGGLSDDPGLMAGPSLCDPGQAIDTLHSVAGLINRLFLRAV